MPHRRGGRSPGVGVASLAMRTETGEEGCLAWYCMSFLGEIGDKSWKLVEFLWSSCRVLGTERGQNDRTCWLFVGVQDVWGMPLGGV